MVVEFRNDELARADEAIDNKASVENCIFDFV